MESKTKTDFPVELIQTLTKDQFGSSVQIAEIVPLTDGWFNTAYAIQFANTTPNAILRIAPPPGMRLLTYEADMMRKEVMVNEILQGMGDIPLPRVLGYNIKRNLIDRDYMFVEKLKGVPYDRIQHEISDGDKAMIHRQLGEIVCRVYRHKGHSWGYIGDGLGSNAATWREAFLAFVIALLEDGLSLGVDLPIPYPDICMLFESHAHALEEIQESVLVHWDLWMGNIFITYLDGVPKIEGIIDWERAFWGDPESEPMIAASYFGPEFFAGLGQPLSQGTNAQTRHCMYGLYLLLVMAIEAKVRFERADHLGWVYAQLTKELERLSQY
jgi:aminoglycoside phosphotransferase (APT) family kinase protein